jgi:phosphogluconate dehydratase
MNKKLIEITEKIKLKSDKSRTAYLKNVADSSSNEVARKNMHCGNLAHAMAGCKDAEKTKLTDTHSKNIAIITAYNDMLSAHKTYEHYPEKIRKYALKYGSVAQVASGVPAMCDGITQGQSGMELSLLSRDVIALSTAVGLSHNVFDGTLLLGICDKIVPGMLIGALQFGHLPAVFVPGGPMKSGISNEEKAKIRQNYAEGKISREELLKGESDSYHSAGTCTFYGTANSNQMLLEIMGLQLPGSSFINPDLPLREKLTEEAVKTIIHNASLSTERSIGNIIDEKAIVNGIIGLLATGGSTNHTIHLIAVAKAAGIQIDWKDISELSEIIPLLARVYPNGGADVNQFHAAGGMGFIIKSLLENNLLHDDVQTILGKGLYRFKSEPFLQNDELIFKSGTEHSIDESILKPAHSPFLTTGGIKCLTGNLGNSVIKVSAVSQDHFYIKAPAVVFDSQEEFLDAFKKNELNRDCIVVLPFQGPKQNGMPELHQLTPALSVLQNRGFKVALVTDGRMSGASGKVPAAIHLSPEASANGPIGKLKSGDSIELDINNNSLNCLEIDFEKRTSRTVEIMSQDNGRGLFKNLRSIISNSEEGGSFLF